MEKGVGEEMMVTSGKMLYRWGNIHLEFGDLVLELTVFRAGHVGSGVIRGARA